MGILNLTPDSFSDGGCFTDRDKAVEHALRMQQQGADIIDLGGESTRPGACEVSAQQEMDRVIPVLAEIRRHSDVAISIDTSKLAVMQAAHEYGIQMINDVRALAEVEDLSAIAAMDVSVCLMHMHGTPATMQQRCHYQDVFAEVKEALLAAVERCTQSALKASKLWLDPGFGFGKNTNQNCVLLQRLPDLRALGYPVIVGLSRKSMIGHLLDLPVMQRLHASVALAVLAFERGADMVRVHDVAATRQALDMAFAVRQEYGP